MTQVVEQHGWAHQPILEREAEVRAIQHALDELYGASANGSGARRGGVLVFAAPAGLGKTTLLAEARRRATERGCTVLSARGGEQEKQVPFHVVRQLIQPTVAAMSEGEHREILGHWYGIVAPAIGLTAPQDGTAPDPQGVRDGLDWVVTRLSVRSTPVVLILDDAHWADAESLAWLTAFATRAEQLGMLIVVACRPDELPPDATVLHTLASRHGARPHQLEPLTSSAVARIVRSALGDGADDLFCRECWTITGGNPFEVVELTAKARERGLKPQRDTIPHLRDLASAVKGSGLIERLEQLGPSTVRLAWAAAVLGTGISTRIAASVAALGDAQINEAIDQLHAARILTVLTTVQRDEVVEFFHPLIATAVYRSIPPGVRVAMHGMAAKAVIDAGLGAGAAARHMLEMHPEGDSWVVQHLRQAARENFSAGAPDAARRYLARALREPPIPEDRAHVLFELGSASLLHEPATTVNHLRAALEEPEIEQGLREDVIYRLAQALAHTGQLAEATELLADEARRTSSARAKLRMQAEQFKWNAVRVDEQDSPARSRLLAQFAKRLTGHSLAERHILGLRGWDCVMRGEPSARALQYAERALDGGLRWTDQDFGFEVPAVIALTLMYCDQPGRAEELFSDAITEFEARGWRGAHLSFAYTLLGYVRYRRGRLTEAEDFARQGLEIADRVGRGIPAQWQAVGTLIETQLAHGHTAEAQRVADAYDFGKDFPNSVIYPDPQAVWGKLLLARGMHDEAERQLAEAGQRLDSRGTRNPSWSPWQLDLALAQAKHQPEKARATAQEAVARARAFGTAGVIGHALRVQAATTDPAEAVVLLQEAVEHLEKSPAAYELAHALVDHGTALHALGDLERAAHQLYSGMEAATGCGAEVLATRARTELAAAGLSPRRRQVAEQDTLSEAESAAARHAALGLDNAAIAAELGTGEHAVSKLLSAVFTKLGTDRGGLRRALGM
ncbi:tetratricopeptide (TPR) repeat protein/DNA-binding CsgD family transcriptional regulator [Streptomyces sp. V4I23]|uniref:ATP-binding protein n=1 Tax=Streptomyces sp. V4I23 TaxID=3042282 RepID=UPI00278A251C|nr:AAA family ATPase [Streptomyces sp. V4I23]MDQ1012293.1 tetratricopeptide (TPR) repeat protein/DNA-binding CsgD family transcriptional regulator [Streptomyces sp. V4I23]